MTTIKTTEIIVPSNPADQKKLRNAVQEIVDSLYRVQSEKDLQKDILDEFSKDFNIDKKYIRQMAIDAYKDEFQKKSNEFDSYATLYETIMVVNQNETD